jgi:hypothetical protein
MLTGCGILLLKNSAELILEKQPIWTS